jgi:hypothetical protein
MKFKTILFLLIIFIFGINIQLFSMTVEEFTEYIKILNNKKEIYHLDKKLVNKFNSLRTEEVKIKYLRSFILKNDTKEIQFHKKKTTALLLIGNKKYTSEIRLLLDNIKYRDEDYYKHMYKSYYPVVEVFSPYFENEKYTSLCYKEIAEFIYRIPKEDLLSIRLAMKIARHGGIVGHSSFLRFLKKNLSKEKYNNIRKKIWRYYY